MESQRQDQNQRVFRTLHIRRRMSILGFMKLADAGLNNKGFPKNDRIVMRNSIETAELFFSAILFSYASHVLIKAFEQSLLPEKSSQQPGKYILPIFFNLSHAIECYLKSFLHYKEVPMQTLKSREWEHNLKFLHDEAIKRDLYKITNPDAGEDISYINDKRRVFSIK